MTGTDDDDGSGLASFNALVIIGPLTAKCLARGARLFSLSFSAFFPLSSPLRQLFPVFVPPPVPARVFSRVSVLVNWENNLLF